MFQKPSVEVLTKDLEGVAKVLQAIGEIWGVKFLLRQLSPEEVYNLACTWARDSELAVTLDLNSLFQMSRGEQSVEITKGICWSLICLAAGSSSNIRLFAEDLPKAALRRDTESHGGAYDWQSATLTVAKLLGILPQC